MANINGPASHREVAESNENLDGTAVAWERGDSGYGEVATASIGAKGGSFPSIGITRKW
jgi:hypothetical protein